MASECRSRRLTGEASASGEITDWRESDCAHASESDMQEDPIVPMKRHAGQPVSGKSTWTYRDLARRGSNAPFNRITRGVAPRTGLRSTPRLGRLRPEEVFET